jgi:hypothetical protein
MTIAVAKQYLHNGLTSWLKNLLCKRLLKLQAISVFSCPNSTANSILLSSSGVQSRNIFGIIVTVSSTLEHAQGEHAESAHISKTQDNSSVGALDALLDGCISGSLRT